MMEDLVKLINVLKEEKIIEGYNNILSSCKGLEKSIVTVSDVVDDLMLQVIADKNYDKLPVYTDLQQLIQRAYAEVQSLTSDSDTVEKEVEEVKEIKEVKKVVEEKNSEDFKGFLTSVDGIKIGAKLYHNTYGLGKIIKIEDSEKSDIKIMTVKFENEEKRFNCTQEVLNKYFVGDDENKSSKIQRRIERFEEVGEVEGIKYNLYTKPEFFKFLRPVSITVFDKTFEVSTWLDLTKVFINYMYSVNKEVLIHSVEAAPGYRVSKNEKDFNRSISLGGSGLFIEGTKSSEDLIKLVSFIAEKFLDVFNKDVRRNSYILVKK